MTQKQNIEQALTHLVNAVDCNPDKTDEIQKYNTVIYAIIDILGTYVN